MILVILLILAVAWIAALVPAWLRSRREDRAAESIVSFRRHLSTLQRATPAGRYAIRVAPPLQPVRRHGLVGRSAARRRRRDILLTLALVAVLTSLMAVVLRGVAIIIALAAAALLLTYAVMLIQLRKRSIEREKVQYLVSRRSPLRPAMMLRRSASN